MELDSDLLNEFIVEAKAHIAELEAGLLQMENLQVDDSVVNGVFRAAHSIKGTASFFGLNKVVELSHTMETLFGELREHRMAMNSEMIDALLSAVDVLKELISNPADGEKYDIKEAVTAIKRFLDLPQDHSPQPEKPAEALSAWDIWNDLMSADTKTKKATSTVSVEVDNKLSVRIAEKNEAVTEAPGSQLEPVNNGVRHRSTVKEDNVRVSVALLNDLMNLAGEMVLRRNQLLRIAQDSERQTLQLDVVAKGIDELTTNLQKKVMKTRMQTISNVFNKFPRIVRDISRKVAKEVDLTLQGMDVELDRSLIEALVDPITHLVRNALDHGIETPDVRERKNKSLTGSLVLRAYHESGRVIVDICDDGAGIDIDKVKAKALEKGIVSEKEISVMREADIMNLILHPGFSTAEEVTDISGRGVGMDVVKTNIEKLGGKIEIISELGKGTTFRLILPLTLAIISSFIVVTNGQSFAIPQANVRELLLIQPDDRSEKRVEMVHQRPVLRLRGSVLPLVSLRALLAQASATPPDCNFAADSSENVRVLVIKAGNMVYGLIVDSVYDTEEILVKPLSAALGSCGLYSGVTVLGDGSIAMILDTESIRLRAGLSSAEELSQPVAIRAEKTIDEEKQYILLFKCSGGEMLGLDMAMVSRVEEVDISKLQKIGSKYYFSFQGKTTRVIRPEYYMPISRRKNKLSKVFIILPKMVKHAVGIIAEEIHDAVYTSISLDEDGVCGTGIVGSALIEDKVVILLNMHELFGKAVPEYYERMVSPITADTERYSSKDAGGPVATVLLAEDMPFFRKIVKSFLESDGYNVITAENGRAALDMLAQAPVDIVVSDVEMPIMTGIELVRAIRASEALRNLPVIALTSLTGEANKEKGLRAGFDIYQYKLDRVRLLDSVRDLLRTGRVLSREM